MKPLALFLGFGIAMNASSIAAIHGRQAKQLELSGCGIIDYLPWIVTAVIVLGTIAVLRIRKNSIRWFAFIGLLFFAAGVSTYPLTLLRGQSVPISVTDFPNASTKTAFEATYPIRWISYASSSEGHIVRVRKDDYSPEMAEAITRLIAGQRDLAIPATKTSTPPLSR